MFADARKEYIGKEERRVPVKFYAVVNAGEAVKAAAIDNRGNKVVAFGAEPQKAIRQAINSEVLSDRLGKTGGTPYYCVDAQSRVQSGLYLSASEINELRRKLVTALNERPRDTAAAPQPAHAAAALGAERRDRSSYDLSGAHGRAADRGACRHKTRLYLHSRQGHV